MNGQEKKGSQTTQRGLILCLEGAPTPLARPRFASRHVWDAQKGLKLRDGITMSNQMGSREPYSRAIRVNIIFFMPIALKNKGWEGRPHQARPDLDNLIKYCLDVANKIIYQDDCLIAEIHAFKKYAKIPMTVMHFEEILEENWSVEEEERIASARASQVAAYNKIRSTFRE